MQIKLVVFITALAMMTPLASAAGGSISVVSSPQSANVYLDGVSYGPAPVFIPGVSPGNKVIVCKKSGYIDAQQSVTVTADTVSSVTCTLTLSTATPTPTPSGSTGSIRVSTGNPQASFTVQGPDIFMGSGSTWTKDNIPIGEYTITFDQVPGYKTPMQQTATVQKGKTAAVNVEYDQESNILLLAGAAVILIILVAGGFYYMKQKGAPGSAAVKAAPGSIVVGNTVIRPEIKYSGASVLYNVDIENRSTQPINEVLVSLQAPSSLICLESEKAVQAIEPRGRQSFSFEMRPTGAFGAETLVGRVSFFDYEKDKRQDASLEALGVTVDVPALKAADIDEARFKKFIAGALFNIDEATTNSLPLEAKALFNLSSSVIEGMGLRSLPPVVSEASGLYRGVARFYGEDIRGLKYASEIEVIGQAEGTQMLLKAWGMRDDAVCGFYFKILDQLEGRTRLKKFIDNSIVQDFYWRQDKQENEFLKSLDEAKAAADKDYKEWMEKGGR